MKRSKFEWQVAGDTGEWETIAEIGGKKKRRKWPWWVWVTLSVVFLVAAGSTYLVLTRRFKEINEQITFQIQGVIDLERSAWNRGNINRYLGQQDSEALAWYGYQARLIDIRADVPDDLVEQPKTKISEVNVQGDIAWVEVLEGDNAVKKMRFYRQSSLGWLHTAPDPAFWGSAVEYHYGDDIIFRFTKRDQPYVEPLLEELGETFYTLCDTLGCPTDKPYEVNFMTTPIQNGGLSPRMVPILSPWLSGIPATGEWATQTLSIATYHLARTVGEQTFTARSHDTGNLQQAIVDEYAAWVSTGDLTQAPLLGRIIARRREEILPDVFRSLKRDPSLTLFLGEWLNLRLPTENMAAFYFETLLNIEQEAWQAGRKDTFMLLQDTEESIWASHQLFVFEQTQALRDTLTLEPIQVEQIELQETHAIMSTNANKMLTSRPVIIFRLRNGNWKHNDFSGVTYRLSQPIPAPTPPIDNTS